MPPRSVEVSLIPNQLESNSYCPSRGEAALPATQLLGLLISTLFPCRTDSMKLIIFCIKNSMALPGDNNLLVS